jgi:hypothetical protein
MLVPRYDCDCSVHGLHETVSVPSIAISGSVPCAHCGVAARVVPVININGVRIDCAGDALTARDSPQRVVDGSAAFNMGLAGVTTSLGRDASGKERLAYRAISHREVGSNARARELAKAQGLTPIDGGRYRSLRQ